MRTLRMILTMCMILSLALSVGAKEKIAVWHSLDQRIGEPTFMEIVDAFQQKFPNIEVEVVNAGSYGKALEKMQVAWAGGAAPNVAMLEQTRNTVFYYHGGLLALDSYINGPNGTNIKDYSQTMLGAVTYDGKIYGLPYNTSTPLLYYNKDLFLKSGLAPAAPKTWNEILTFSRKLSSDIDGDGTNDVWGIDFYEWGWLFEGWIGQNGARVLNDSVTEFTFNSDAAVEAMQFTQDLVHRYNVARFYPPSGYNFFWDGKLGMTERSTASLADNISKANFDMGVAPLACNKECYAAIGGGNFVLFDTGTKAQKDASWEFLKFITSTDQLAKFSAATGYMAARRSTFASSAMREVFNKDARYRATYEQMEVAYPRPKVPFWESMSKDLVAFYKVQFAQNGNIKQALDELARTANIKLKEWRATLQK